MNVGLGFVVDYHDNVCHQLGRFLPVRGVFRV